MDKQQLNKGRVRAGKSAAAQGSAEQKVKGLTEQSGTAQVRATHDKHPFDCGHSNKA